MILVVDDNQENIYSLKTLLELHKYEVDTALSGEEALKKLLKIEYALIILDVQMPGMDGYEVAEILSGSSKSKDVPILFLSAVHIDKHFILKGYESGGVDYLTKPIDPDLLLLKVKTFYRLYMQAKELRDIKSTLEEKVEERTKELLQLNEELERSNMELQQYASIASHDLQEPLRKIITFCQLIVEQPQSITPEAGSYLKKVISSAERMRSLIHDLLTYSKLSSESHFHQVNLNDLIHETLSDLELSIKEKEASIDVADLPSIEAIPGQMRQVFQNILSNALKFSKKEQPPRISIWAEPVEQDLIDAEALRGGRYIRIFIQDNGIGFDEIYLQKVFTLFQRLHTRQYEGTGIGLAIVKKIVEKHNGLLSAKSKEGEGTTFIIVLPVQQTGFFAQPQ